MGGMNMIEENEKPDFKKPATHEQKIFEKIGAGIEKNEKARKEPLLKADELQKILGEENNE
jgi:hypothetical protein